MYSALSFFTRSLDLSLFSRSFHVTGVPPRKILSSFAIDNTSLPSGSSTFCAVTCGSSSDTPVFIIGAVIMKMISSTSMTSTIGVTLISAFSSSPPDLNAIARYLRKCRLMMLR